MNSDRQAFEQLRTHLVALHKEKTFRQIAQEDYAGKVNHAAIHRIVVYGQEPQKAEIRKALGLPELLQVPVLRDERGRFTRRKYGSR